MTHEAPSAPDAAPTPPDSARKSRRERIIEYDATGTLLTGAHNRFQRLGDEILAFPYWIQALVVYTVTRLLTLGIIAGVARHQGQTPWNGPEGPSLTEFLGFWDAEWYWRIATQGYPRVLPVLENGAVAQNQWAFYPLHPWITQGIATLTGVDYLVISPLLSVTAGAVAAVFMLRIFRMHLTAGQALTALTFFFVYPATPTLMSGYSEALALMFLVIALNFVIERRYLAAVLPVFLMDITRPIGVGFAFFMLIHLLDRIRRRRSEPYGRGEVIRSWTLGVLSCVAALVHPVAAWIWTGSMTAYVETEAAWTGHTTRIFGQWADRAERLAGPFGLVILAVAIAAFLVVIFGPVGRTMGRVSQQWVIGYTLYLLLFFTPQTSTFRLFLPLFPIAIVFALKHSWTLRFTVIGASLLLQVWWLRGLWYYSASMTPP